MNWCKLGFHKWGKIKQWAIDGKVVNVPKCKRCGKVGKAKD